MFIKASALPSATLVAGLLVFLAGLSPAASRENNSSVANANAQLLSPGMPGENARMTSARASDLSQAAADGQADPKAENETELVAADQLNDVDRSLREGSSQPAASEDRPPAQVAAVSGENSSRDRTTLIGKIFIGFGALLTVASAVRMFMA